MRIRRSFSQEFKRETTEAIVSGKVSQLEISRKYGISPVIISRWKKEYYASKFFENSLYMIFYLMMEKSILAMDLALVKKSE